MSKASAALIASIPATAALLALFGHRAAWLAYTLAVIVAVEVVAVALTWKGNK
jgi:hypothetical protein